MEEGNNSNHIEDNEGNAPEEISSIKDLLPSNQDQEVEELITELKEVEELITELNIECNDNDEEVFWQTNEWKHKKKHIFILSSAGKPIYSR